MSSFLCSEISSRAEDILLTFLLSMSVEHTDPLSRSLFCPDIEESVAKCYLGTSPSSFATGRTSRKKPIYKTKWELQVMMPWQTPHFNPFTKSQSNPTGSEPAFLTNTAPGGFSSPQVTWYKMTHCYCICVFWILAHRYFSFSKAFLCHYIWSTTSIVKEGSLSFKMWS